MANSETAHSIDSSGFTETHLMTVQARSPPFCYLEASLLLPEGGHNTTISEYRQDLVKTLNHAREQAALSIQQAQ